jgi:hypothetical protein
VGVAGEIGKHCGGTGEGALGVDDPLDLPERCEPLGEAGGSGELGVLAKETEFAATMKLLEFFEWFICLCLFTKPFLAPSLSSIPVHNVGMSRNATTSVLC